MFFMLLVLLTTAFGAPLEQQFTWDLTVDGRHVGERALKVRYLPANHGMRRLLQSWTDVNANVLGLPYRFQQRLTAHIGEGPASFHSVVVDNKKPREIQGRRTWTGWLINITEEGTSKRWDFPAHDLDFSTVDFLDPESWINVLRYERIRVLSAETGAIWEGPLTLLGSSEVEIEGQHVRVEGIAWGATGSRTELYFSPDGYLVRYTTKMMGKTLEGRLRTLPPPGLDNAPIEFASDRVREIEL